MKEGWIYRNKLDVCGTEPNAVRGEGVEKREDGGGRGSGRGEERDLISRLSICSSASVRSKIVRVCTGNC